MSANTCWAKIRTVREMNAAVMEAERAGRYVYAHRPMSDPNATPQAERVVRFRSRGAAGMIEALSLNSGKWFAVADTYDN